MSIQWPSTSYAEDIARAVHEILSSAGADALTIRGIARAARVSPGTLANQFESREGLLARIALVVGRLLAVDLARRDLGQTGVDRLCTMVVRDEYERADLKVWLDLVALARALRPSALTYAVRRLACEPWRATASGTWTL